MQHIGFGSVGPLTPTHSDNVRNYHHSAIEVHQHEKTTRIVDTLLSFSEKSLPPSMQQTVVARYLEPGLDLRLLKRGEYGRKAEAEIRALATLADLFIETDTTQGA